MENNFQNNLNKYLLKKDINSGITGILLLTIIGNVLFILISLALTIISAFYTNRIYDAQNAVNYVLSTDNIYGLLINMLLYIFYFTVPFLSISAARRYPMREIISFKKPKFSHVFYAFFITIGFSFVASYITNFIINFLGSFGISVNNPITEMNTGSIGSIVLYFVHMAIIPPLVEEFAIRGVVLGSVKKYSKSFAIVFSALLFSLMHGTFYQIPYAFVAGLVMGYFVIKFDSIWIGIIVHFLNNSISVIFEFLSKVIENENLLVLISSITNLTLLLIGAITLIVFVLNNKIGIDKDEDSCSFSECFKTMLKRPLFYILLIFSFITVILSSF
ncbi:MAG: CPBP family intramembrane metalloprotease [Ruminococcaceae bacterium]|nr:CPBP family intramembrane metalloprotease [Oscillospiraceae bacterium]